MNPERVPESLSAGEAGFRLPCRARLNCIGFSSGDRQGVWRVAVPQICLHLRRNVRDDRLFHAAEPSLVLDAQ